MHPAFSWAIGVIVFIIVLLVLLKVLGILL
jgi:hypothetical protein